MATRKGNATEPQPARLSSAEMRTAIPKLQRRIADLRALNVDELRERTWPAAEMVEAKIEDTLVEIFGADTLDYRRFAVGSLDTASINFGNPTPLSDVKRGYRDGITNGIGKLTTAIELLEEKLADTGDTPRGKAIRALGDLDLHPEIERAAGQLFRDGHYANAIEDACKALDALVRLRSGKELSGTELMQVVFSPKAPVLRFNDQTNDSERSEQQGMMYFYSGVMLAFRNPRAHGLLQDDAEKALEVISFISFLAKALDNARR